MPQKRISFSNFNRRLDLSGGREQGQPTSVRRASGIAPEATNSVLSRWGSQTLYNITALQCYYWNNVRYQYDGTALYANGISIKTGFNGGRLAFNSMPPQIGLQDYLFILGGGVTPFKIDPLGNITNWGIVAPGNSIVATNIANDQIVIDAFNNTASNWLPIAPKGHVAQPTNTSAEFITGTASMEVNPSASPWRIANTVGTPFTLATYPNNNNDISLNTDIFQIWVFIDEV